MIELGTTIPALPVRSIPEATAFYRDRLGFEVPHEDTGFAIVSRDRAQIHLWASDDESWHGRQTADRSPVVSGAESFIAGTASCRVEVEGVDELQAELAASEVLHPNAREVAETDHGTREFAALDLDGNLLTFFARVRPATAG